MYIVMTTWLYFLNGNELCFEFKQLNNCHTNYLHLRYIIYIIVAIITIIISISHYYYMHSTFFFNRSGCLFFGNKKRYVEVKYDGVGGIRNKV